MQPACEGPVALARVVSILSIAAIEPETRLDESEIFAYPVRQHVACSPTPGSGDTRRATIWSPLCADFLDSVE
jgi:hypothetical protein